MNPYTKTASYDVGTFVAAGPSVAVLEDGSYVVAWNSYGNYGGLTVSARHLSAAGVPLGDAFVVHATADASQPIVTALPTGGYAITYTGADGEGLGIATKVFNSADQAVGSEFVVNTVTAGYQADPSVAKLADGSFVVSWWGGTPATVSAQHFSATGTPIGTEIQVTAALAGQSDAYPSVAGLANGGFVILWNHGTVDSDGNSSNVLQAQVFGADGQPTTPPVTVNDAPVYYNSTPTISAVGLSTGGFAIVYESASVPGGSGQDIALQYFSDDASPSSGVILANAGNTYSWQTNISALALPNGQVAVSWLDGSSGYLGSVAGLDGSVQYGGSLKPYNFAVFDANGSPVTGPETAGLNITGFFDQSVILGMAAKADGSLVTVARQSATGDANQIVLQVFSPNDVRIESGGGGDTGAYTITENVRDVATIVATGTSQPVTYSIHGGSDAALFQINAATGELSFIAAPNYEAPADTGQDNVYNVTVRAQSGSAVDDQALTITVTDIQEYNLIVGTATRNTLTGTTGDDHMLGLAGNDTLIGLAGNDILDGGLGRDKMSGGLGDDIYIVDSRGDTVIEGAGEGTDTVQTTLARYVLGDNVENLTFTDSTSHTGVGNELSNHIIGGAGNDLLNGKAGADVLEGGLGDDTYYVDNAGDIVVELAGGGNDAVFASVSFALSAGAEVEAVTLRNAQAAVALTGSNSENVLTGNGNANVISGLDGNDTLIGGKGRDTLTGGAGADTFVFDTKPNAASNLDTITDFVSGTDKLALDHAVFTGFATIGAISADSFWSGAGVNTAHDADDRLIYNTSTGVLWYDADGTGSGRAVQVAVLSGHPALAFGDILILA